MDAWGHHIARHRAACIEAVLRQSFAEAIICLLTGLAFCAPDEPR
jgi:hypothetical protein